MATDLTDDTAISLARELYHTLGDDDAAIKVAATLLGLVVARSHNHDLALAGARHVLERVALHNLSAGKVLN